MKINNLTLHHITRYEDSQMTFSEKLAVILAPNAAGKTTILDAIALALTGACDRTDKAGKGQENLVTTGQQQGSITATVSNNGAEPLEVTRFVPGELQIAGQHGNKTQLQANLNEYLGTENGALSAALSTTAFIDAKPSEQKGLLFNLLGLSFDMEGLAGKLGLELGAKVSLADVGSLLKAAPASCWTGGADTFDKLYKNFYALRRDYKRDLKALGELPPVPTDPTMPDAEKVRKDLDEIRGLKAGLERKASGDSANMRVRARLATEITDLSEKLKDAGDPEAATEEYDNLVSIIGPLEFKQDGLKREREMFTEVADTLEESGKKCPLGKADAPVECSMTKAKREKVIADYRERAEAAKTEWFEIKTEIDPMELRRRELIPLKNRPSSKAIKAQAAEKQAELDELPAPDLDGSVKHDSEIATLTERIHKGESVLADINRIEGAKGERERQLGKRSQLEQTVEVLEALVEVLSPSGLPGKILSETIGPIEGKANERLQQLTGGRYSLQLVLDPDFAIIVSHDGVTTDLKRLSSSERFRIGLVLQDAIVHLSGLRFLIIDQLDVLDPINSELCMNALLSMAEDYDQILVLRTLGKGEVLNPHVPDVGFYLLEDGQLREVA